MATSPFNKLLNWLGLTDTEAPERGLEELKSGASAASTQLENRMAPVMDMYGNAMTGRDMGSVLDTYKQQMMGTENAAGAENVAQFLNPQYGRAIDAATMGALAGAGSSLQSSAANKAVGTAVGDTVSNMWQQAFQNAMTDASNKQGIYGSTMQSEMMPSLNWAQLTSDLAGNEYTKNMDLAQAGGQVAGMDQSWFGSLF